jgi:hypothetical protein
MYLVPDCIGKSLFRGLIFGFFGKRGCISFATAAHRGKSEMVWVILRLIDIFPFYLKAGQQ